MRDGHAPAPQDDHDAAAAGAVTSGAGGNGAALHSDEVRRRRPEHSHPGRPGRLGSVPVRTCVGCRTRERATDLLRVVVVNGRLVPDPRRRLPGRGAWLHPVEGCLDRAERRSAFTRALRVPGPLDVTDVRTRLGQDREKQDRTRETSGPTPEESTVDQS